MKRFHSVKKNIDFRAAYTQGRSYSTKEIVMYVMPNGLEYNRLGVSASKKIGNSVVRHTVVRKFREIFRLNEMQLNKGYDIIIVVRLAGAKADYKILEGAYMRLCGRHHIVALDEAKKN